MKSGSLRAMAPRPKIATDCGTPISTICCPPPLTGAVFERGSNRLLRQAAENVVDHLPELGGVDVTDRNDFKLPGANVRR